MQGEDMEEALYIRSIQTRSKNVPLNGPMLWENASNSVRFDSKRRMAETI